MKHGMIISVIALIGIGFIIYANSIFGEFLYDDEILVEKNVNIRSLAGVRSAFTENMGSATGKKFNFYRPIQMISYVIDYSLYESGEVGYHVTNILLHISASLLLFWFIHTLFGDTALSVLTSLFFLVHPVHVGAVAYLSGRADSISAIFLLIGLVLYIKEQSLKRPGLYMLMLLCYVLALLSKESSIIFPALLFLYHFTFKKKIEVRSSLPVLIITVLYIVLRISFLKSFFFYPETQTNFVFRLPGFFVAVTNYVKLLLFPINLHMEYSNEIFSFFDAKAISGLLSTALIMFYSFKKRHQKTLFFFCVFWFFITLLPVANIYPINAYMAEHWLYLPSIGFFTLLAALACYLYRKTGFRIPAFFVVSLIVFSYSFATIRQNSYWEKPKTFFERTLIFAPLSPKALNGLGNEYTKEGNYDRAIVLYKKAIANNPDYADSYNNLGYIYAALKKYRQARSLFEKAISINPGYRDAYCNLGSIHALENERDRAIVLFKKALEIDPYYGLAHNNLASAYYFEKKPLLAVKHCKKALEARHEVHPEVLELLESYETN